MQNERFCPCLSVGISFIPGQARGETRVRTAHYFDVFINKCENVFLFRAGICYCIFLSFTVSRIVEEARGEAHVDSCSPALSTENTLTVNKYNQLTNIIS